MRDQILVVDIDEWLRLDLIRTYNPKAGIKSHNKMTQVMLGSTKTTKFILENLLTHH